MESTTDHSKRAGTKKENSTEKIGLTSEILSTACTSRKKSIEQNVVIKPYSVLLKDISHERKEKHDYCLMGPNGKKSAPQTRHKKAAVFKNLQVALHDVLDKHCMAELKKLFQIQNVEALLDKEKAGTPESNKEVDSSAKVREFSGELDPGEMHSDCDIRKTETRANSSELLVLSDQSFSATFSSVESNHGNVVMGPCPAQTDEEGKESFQKASVLISNAEKWSTKCSDPMEKCMEYGSHMVTVTGREDACCKTEDQVVEIMISRSSSETAISEVAQPSSINYISISDKGFLQSKEIIPAFSKDTFSKISVRRMAASTLTDASGPPSSFSGIHLKLDLKTIPSNRTEIKMLFQERMGLSLNTLTEKSHEDQVAIKEESNTMSSNKNIDSFWVLLKNSDILDDEAVMCVSHEEKSGELAYGDNLSDHGAEFLVLEGNSACQGFPDVDAAFIYSGIRKTVLVEHKEDCFFNNEKENMDPQPAEENNYMGV